MQRNALTLLAALALSAMARGQATAILPPSKDTAIFSNGNTASGGGDLVTGRTLRFGNRRALLRFELSSIPVGSTIVSAALEMTVGQTNSGPAATSLHPLQQDWGEGTAISPGGAGAPANPGDATWNDAFFGSIPWQMPGGDFGTATSTIMVAGPARYRWPTSPAMTTQVQAWLDNPQTNHGWIAITDESATSARLWSSREFAQPADRPALTVDYIPPASVTNFGMGCPIHGFVPSLQAGGLPQLGNSAFALSLSGVPNGLGLLFFSPTSGLSTFQGCTVFLGPNLDFVDAQPVTATTSFALPVPNAPILAGLEFVAQSLSLTVQGQASTSNGLRLRVGN